MSKLLVLELRNGFDLLAGKQQKDNNDNLENTVDNKEDDRPVTKEIQNFNHKMNT